jgi:hypothetical protein
VHDADGADSRQAAFERREILMSFRVRDLMITVVGGRGGDAGLVDPDTNITDFSPISPWVHLAKYQPAFAHLGHLAKAAAMRGEDVAPVLDAPRVQKSIGKLGDLMVGATVVGAVGMPDPNCEGGSDLPPWLSPIAFEQLGALQIEDLATLRIELARVSVMLDEVESRLVPDAEQTPAVVAHLKGAIDELRDR